MKTSFFSRFYFKQEDKNKLLAIQEMEEPLFSIFFKHFTERQSITSKSDQEVREMVKESGKSPEQVINGANIFFWFVRFFARHYQDDIEDIIKDIIELHPEYIKDAALFTSRVKRIDKLSVVYRPLFKADDAKEDGHPLLEQLSTCVVIKPVFEQRFDFNINDIKEYKPKRIDKVACAIIELKNSYDQYFSFQMNGFELERHINALIALQIELKTFENEY